MIDVSAIRKEIFGIGVLLVLRWQLLRSFGRSSGVILLVFKVVGSHLVREVDFSHNLQFDELKDFETIDLTYVVAASIQINNTSPNKSGLGHPEENHDQRNPKSSTHSIECSFVAAVLYDITGYTSRVSKSMAFCTRAGYSPTGCAKLMPPSTPRLNIDDRYPRSWTNLLFLA